MTHLTRSIVLATLILGTSNAAAQTEPQAPATTPVRVPHVRPGDPLATTVLHDAAAASPTVAGLLAGLEQTDIIVTIVTGRLPEQVNGYTRIVTAAGGARYLRIILKIPNVTERLIATLGHELRHAMEIAGMPDVRDEASLAAAYRRVGVAMARDGFFETDAAVQTGKLVAREVTESKRMPSQAITRARLVARGVQGLIRLPVPGQ
jgi:hypothetical protein